MPLQGYHRFSQPRLAKFLRSRYRVIQTLAAIVRLFLALGAVPATAATNLLPGFEDITVVTGLTSATAMQFAPDGRLFVAQQGGTLRVIKNGVLLATPFVALSVDSSGERGLLGIAFDPNFQSNQYVYLFWLMTENCECRPIPRDGTHPSMGCMLG